MYHAFVQSINNVSNALK